MCELPRSRRRATGSILAPNLAVVIPRASAECHSILRNADTAHAIRVPGETSYPHASERIPDVDVEVVVASKEEPPGVGEVARSYSAHDIRLFIGHEFSVRANVKELACGIVRGSAEGLAARKVVHAVDVRLVAHEGFLALFRTHVPELGCSIARARDEGHLPLVLLDRDGQHITIVICILGNECARFNVPKHARHVPRCRDNLMVTDEPARGQVARMRCQLSRNAVRGAPEVVHGAHIVEPAACCKVARRRVRARHDP
mmetsp:Transcript_28180/g.75866  ORF Transcript_28180/g.75866 Transcript_28180/m.75866 type:complete len:259 (+) Transcript_28180:144-920(+)